MTAADTLRQAATRARDIGDPLHLALADWLNCEQRMAESAHLWTEREACGWCGTPAAEHALAVARQLLGTGEQPKTEAAPEVADRAAILREAADECDEAGAAYTARAQNEHAAGAFALMETFRRKADEAEPTPAATEQADTEAQPPGGFTTRVCRNCRTAITWTPTGDWTHENADQECTVAALFELPTECHTAATEEATR